LQGVSSLRTGNSHQVSETLERRGIDIDLMTLTHGCDPAGKAFRPIGFHKLLPDAFCLFAEFFFRC